MPDHIAVQLEFMSRLCEEEESDLPRFREVEKTFLEMFLLRWIHPFLDRVIESNSLFYTPAARTLKIFVDNDYIVSLKGDM